MAAKETRLVYSTELGDQRKANPFASALAGHQSDKPVRVSADNKGRKGKFVTLVTNLPGTPEEIAQLVKELRVHCGTGGSVTEEGVVVQGDHRTKVSDYLKKKGFTVKLV